MGETITIRTGAATEVIKVIEQGPQGPAGPAGTGLETLTTQGDMLYRDASGGQRLSIGTAGQILKVNAGATAPEWGAAPASGVSSVNGETGEVTLDAADVGALQSQYSIETFIYDALSTATLPARRNVRWTVDFTVSGGTRTLNLPSANVLVGDRIHVALTAPAGTTVIVRKPQPGSPLTLATLSGGSRFVFGAEVTQIVGGTPVWQSLGELQASVGAIPATSSAVGTIGSFVFAEQFMYVCIAPDTWRRVPIAAF
jgi:hypothetical protein